MATRTSRFSLGITGKLLLWCLVLIAIFYANTSVLVVRMREMVGLSNHIVSVNHYLEEISEEMVQRLLAFEESLKRHQILRANTERELSLVELDKYGQLLASTAPVRPADNENWQQLASEYAANRGRDWGGGDPRQIEALLDRWIKTLLQERDINKREMDSQLQQLFIQGRQVTFAGVLGLTVSLVVGLAGSLYLAYRFGRSLKNLKRGIRDYGQDGQAEPLQITSQDEFGELATTFNQMLEQLQREEEMRTEFISMLSHEIRTPLTSIRETVELVRDRSLGEVNERQTRFLDVAGQEIDRLSKLLEQLMQVSSLQSQGPVLDPREIDPESLAREAAERLSAIAQRRDVTMDLDLNHDGRPVWADQDHVRQVLLNLIGNALKFSPPGSQVRLSVARHEEGQGVVFCVRDNGPGIPLAEQAFVFQKYYRGADVARTTDGAGLGLAISKRVVEAHGGRMWFSSQPGEGSTFCFVLPYPRGIR